MSLIEQPLNPLLHLQGICLCWVLHNARLSWMSGIYSTWSCVWSAGSVSCSMEMIPLKHFQLHSINLDLVLTRSEATGESKYNMEKNWFLLEKRNLIIAVSGSSPPCLQALDWVREDVLSVVLSGCALCHTLNFTASSMQIADMHCEKTLCASKIWYDQQDIMYQIYTAAHMLQHFSSTLMLQLSCHNICATTLT